MPGVAGNQADVAIGATLLRILMPYLFFVSISGLLAGWLNIAGSYYIGYASVSCLNIAMIAGAIIGGMHDGNIYALAISVFAGGLCQMFMVYAYSWLKGFRFTALAPIDPDVKNTYKLLIPSLAGVGISQMNFLVGRIIASFLQAGSISWLFYANRLFQFPLGVFSVTIATVSLTELSKARTNEDTHNVHKLIDKAIIAILLVIIPATIGLVGLAKEIIELIFARNAFTQFDVVNTASALQMYSAGLLFYSLASVFTRVFHSEKNIKTPVKVAAVTFVINLIGNLILMKPMAHAGIALASTIAAGVNAVILYILIKGYRFNIKANVKLLVKIVLAAYIMTATLITCKIMGLHVLINIFACIFVYFGLLAVMKVNIRGIFR
jgi:putative peptidoglycan lipid II flippase